MKLNDPLPTSFSFEGKEYNLDLSFDNVLDLFDVMADKFLRDYEKIDTCLELITGESGPMELWNYIYENFIQIKVKKVIKYDRKGNPLPQQEQDEDEKIKSIDLEKDSEYIHASFIQAYGINLLREHGKLHWHEFSALLNGLPHDTIIQRIIQIRQWKPSKGDSKEYKEEMKRLQEFYTLDEGLEEYPFLC